MHKQNKGFTVIELLVVIAIIGLLSTLAFAAVKTAQSKAQEAKALNDINTISKALAMLANDTGEWSGHQTAFDISAVPASNEYCGLDSLGSSCGVRLLSADTAGITSTDGSFPGWQGPYMKKVELDPWNREYFFDTDYSVKNADKTPCAGTAPCTDVVVVGSYGPDGLGVPTGGANAYGEDDIIKIIYE